MVFPQWVRELLDPCFDCHPRARVQRSSKDGCTPRSPGHRVEVAASPLAGLRGFAGYHTSVLVAGEEYYFSPCGICCSPKLSSHEASGSVERKHVGVSRHSGVDLLDFLTDHFRPGTYDLLRKNCNSFTDCALFFLCGERLDPCFRQLERLGRAADERAKLVQVMSRGEYLPNERALAFNLEAVLAEIEQERECRGCEDGPSFELPESDGDDWGDVVGKGHKWKTGGSAGAGYVSDSSNGSTRSSNAGSSGAGSVDIEHPWLSDKVVQAKGRRTSNSGWEVSLPQRQPQRQPALPEPGRLCVDGAGAPRPARRRRLRQATPLA